VKLSLIAAIARNGVIGKQGALPWKLPDELRYFKAQTLGKPVIMGRRTWESLRGPLPGRTNVVVTTQADYTAIDASIVHTLQAAIDLVSSAEECMVIGGAELYRAALPIADRLYLTHVEADVEGDTRWEIDLSKWRVVREERHEADARHAYPFRMVVYERL
jgi:dihydrofolate reductase